MPKSPNSKEKICEHDCYLIFNELAITKITITDYYQTKPGRKMITHELIVELVKTLDGRQAEPEPKKNPNDREVFVRNRIVCKSKKYRLIFWFKDGTNDHLWVRNCHEQD